MADTDDSTREAAEEGEPLLVRPYILGSAGVPVPRASAETWPETVEVPAVRPEEAVPAAPTPAPARAPRRRLPVAGLVAATVVVVAAAAVFGLVAAFRPRSGGTPQAIVDVSLPPYPTSASAPRSATGTPQRSGTAPAPPAPRTSSTGSPAPSRSSPAVTVSPSTVRPATSAPAGLAPTQRARTPEPTISPVPGSARTGTITGAGGLCLDLNGGVVFDGNHIQVYECNRTQAQVWTLATDGTLRVMGRCAQVVRDGTVRIDGCDGRESAQWRAAANQALINLVTGDCLTDPADGSRSGSGVRVTDCVAAGNQRWRLP